MRPYIVRGGHSRIVVCTQERFIPDELPEGIECQRLTTIRGNDAGAIATRQEVKHRVERSGVGFGGCQLTPYSRVVVGRRSHHANTFTRAVQKKEKYDNMTQTHR